MQMIFINIDRTEKSNSMTGCIVADDGLQEGGEGQGRDAGGQGGQAGGDPLHIQPPQVDIQRVEAENGRQLTTTEKNIYWRPSQETVNSGNSCESEDYGPRLRSNQAAKIHPIQKEEN